MTSTAPVTPEPYTNRTADDVRSGPRLGDRASVLHNGERHNAIVIEDFDTLCIRICDEVYYAGPWMRDPDTIPIPRCIALDPCVGDTFQRDRHQEEVYDVNEHVVRTIDLYGATYTHPRKSWESGARTWTSCKDREGGVRFNPQVGDMIITANGAVAFRVAERQGEALLLDDGRPVSLDLWSRAASGIFPTRYARLVAAGDPA